MLKYKIPFFLKNIKKGFVNKYAMSSETEYKKRKNKYLSPNLSTTKKNLTSREVAVFAFNPHDYTD